METTASIRRRGIAPDGLEGPRGAALKHDIGARKLGRLCGLAPRAQSHTQLDALTTARRRIEHANLARGLRTAKIDEVSSVGAYGTPGG